MNFKIVQFLLFDIILLVNAGKSDDHILKHVRTYSSEEDQAKSAYEVISRLIPEKADYFEVFVNFDLPRNYFQVKRLTNSTQVVITASSGVSACKGFYHYLKYYCGCHISWEGNQLNLPIVFPVVDLEVQSPSSLIYYQNVCTWSYSFTWWTWTEWRKHIDWIALSGITLTLAPFQEDIWTEVYKEYSMSQGEIDNHFSGPGFFAWQRMGNIRGWGGPLTQNFIKFSSDLQTKIVDELRKLGIIVALPAFAGHLPIQFINLFPNATLTSVEKWNKFPDQYASPLFLDPTDPLFTEISTKFLRKIIEKYGTNHIYFSDPFNEVQPRLSTAKYLASAASGIFQGMVNVDANAVWLLQGWMFVKNPFWSDRAVQAFLTAVPQGRMLVLDLQSDQYPQYERTASYHGQPFIWCMLHTFGGTLGMQGSADLVFKRIKETRSNENYTMIGTGITPEGINQNYVLYEFVLEIGWSSKISDVEMWFKYYPEVRYGVRLEKAESAWLKLLKSVYSFRGLERIGGKYTFNRRPSLRIYPWTWYNSTDLIEAWENMLDIADELNDSELFKHDLVDITRQYLQNLADQLYLSIIDEYKSKNVNAVEQQVLKFLNLLQDIEQVLKSNKDFLLGKWLESAKNLGQTTLEKEKYEYNARNQITLWGPDAQICDYANKQWSGIVEDFFYPRWKLFFKEIISALNSNSTINESKVKDKIFKEVENPFNVGTKVYPTEQSGNSIAISKEIYQKWCCNNNNLPLVPFGSDIWKSSRERKRKNRKNRN